MKNSLVVSILFLCFSITVYSQKKLEIECSPGILSSILTQDNYNTAEEIKLTGQVDARDLRLFKQQIFSSLKLLDISEVDIAYYEGDLGTYGGYQIFKENWLPKFSIPDIDSVILPSSITHIDECALNFCTKIRYIEIPSNVTYIGRDALNNCHSLREITIPQAVKTMAWGCLNHCTALEKVTILADLDSIDYGVFYDCTNLKEVTIAGVKSIGMSAFYNCSSLQRIELPSGLEFVDMGAFYNCSALEYIKIPGSLTNIPMSCFYNCNSAKTIIIEEGVKTVGNGAFGNCTSLENLQLASTIELIDYSAFYRLGKLSGTLILPSSLQEVKSSSFRPNDEYNTYISKLIIPKNIKKIDGSSFGGQIGLREIIANPLIPISLDSSNSPFSDLDQSLCILYVPFGTKYLYDTASVWKDFASIIEIDPIRVSTDDIKLSENIQNYTITISSDGECTIEISEDWLHVSYTQLEGEFTLYLQADPNYTNITRTCIITLTFSSENSLKSDFIKVLTIEQEPTILNSIITYNVGYQNIYPNPASTIINTNIPELNELHFYNSAGILVKSYIANNSNTFSVSELPNGMYTVKINTLDTTIATKLQIQK